MSFGLSHGQTAIVVLVAEQTPQEYKRLPLIEPRVHAFGQCLVSILKLPSTTPLDARAVVTSIL